MQDAPPATIWGRPAFASDFCEAVGTPGDLVLIAPSQYHLGVRDENATVASSVHVRFVYDEMTLRITHRIDGAPLWVSAVTPYKGAGTRSPYLTLAVRS
jgi:HK97 family phage major capsid protein